MSKKLVNNQKNKRNETMGPQIYLNQLIRASYKL